MKILFFLPYKYQIKSNQSKPTQPNTSAPVPFKSQVKKRETNLSLLPDNHPNSPVKYSKIASKSISKHKTKKWIHSIDFRFRKANVTMKFHILKNIATLFRFIELCVFLLIIFSKFSTHLPLAFHLSEFLQRVFPFSFSVTSISPRSVFFLGNAIVFVLFLNSGPFSDRDNDTECCNIKADTCFENCENYSMIDETKVISHVSGRIIQRSYSAKIKRVNYEDGSGGPKLKRSVTEICRRGEKSTANCYYSTDEMSSEEFRRTIEAFIERRQRSLREEEFSAIVY